MLKFQPCWAAALGAMLIATGDCARAAVSSGPEVDFVTRPAVAALLREDGRILGRRISAEGAFPGNAPGKSLRVEAQRSAFEVIAAGVLSQGEDRSYLLDRGLLALEWAFQRAGPDGSFPDERGGSAGGENAIFPKGNFLEAAARSILLIQQANVPPVYQRRALVLVPEIVRTARWMASSEDLKRFADRAPNANQILTIAVGIHEAGVLGDNPALKATARRLVVDVMGRQDENGAFPERGGFDTNYQTVSLELLSRYATTVDDARLRVELLQAVRRGTAPVVRRVDDAGRLNQAGNTRTVACGPAKLDRGAKGLHVDSVPLHLYYVAGVLDDGQTAAAAARLQRRGQRFTHKELCGASRAARR